VIKRLVTQEHHVSTFPLGTLDETQFSQRAGNRQDTVHGGRRPPTSALIGVDALAKPEWLIEIEAIAALD
jgi:enamine deaminase RidA (YjgF/YER057c/UK114 family)